MQNNREIIKVHYLRNQFLILYYRRNRIFLFVFFFEMFCRTTRNKKLLLWPVLRSIVEDFRGSSVRFSKPAKLVWIILPMTVCVDQWPSHVSLLKHVGAWVRGSLGPVTLHTNVLMNQSELKWIYAVGAKRGEKCVIACEPCEPQLVSVLHLTPFFVTSSHLVAMQHWSNCQINFVLKLL